MCLNNGDLVGKRYRILTLLGEGSFAETYLAEDTQMPSETDCRVAVKQLRPEFVSQANVTHIVKLFQREAKTLCELKSCSQVAQFKAFFEENDTFYIVQEYIEGDDLSQELNDDNAKSETQVIELLKNILEALIPIHQKGFVHRDIKPDNLIRRKQDGKIVLIDFGSVTAPDSVASRTVIGTPYYAAPEQWRGTATSASDIYAVGRIAIQALTNRESDQLPKDPVTDEILWQQLTSASQSLKKVIQKMTFSTPSGRYQSAEEALEALKATNRQKFLWRLQKKLFRSTFSSLVAGFCLGVLVSLLLHAPVIHTVKNYFPPNDWCHQFNLNDHLSCGEEILLDASNSKNKQEGVKAFANRKYDQAFDYFQKARQDSKNDPETLIYLENAKLLKDIKKTVTLAVAVPIINNKEFDIAEAVLRGAAQVQQDFNQSKLDFGLRILIFNDHNDPHKVESLTKTMLSKNDVIAVIGHYASEVIEKALPIYQQKEIVLISYGSTARKERILGQQNFEKNFFFRTVPSDDKFNIPALIKHLNLHPLTHEQKVAVFYTGGSLYSDSFVEDLRQSLGQDKIIAGDLSTSDGFNSRKLLDDIIAQSPQGIKGIKAFILVPDGRVQAEAYNNIFKLINVNPYNIPMGASTLNLLSTDLLNADFQKVKNLWIVTPWHPFTSPNQNVVSDALKLWGTRMIGPIAAMSYDSTLVLTKALETLSPEESPAHKRREIQKQLTDANFKVNNGASGLIYFDKDGERKGLIPLVTHILPLECSDYRAIFSPIQFSQEKAKDLVCQQNANL